MNGGHLTSIHSFEENAFVAALAETGIRWEQFTHPTWIGLKQENGSNRKFWTWTDGTKVDYLAWAPNQPDNFGTGESCTQIFADRCVNENTYPYQKWNDVSCTTMMRSFVCKKAALH
ncbi:unnamed protein product [Cylicocyclus nassatus]|uniref:C-type lectin domain-containing protein n=1 Tax=Cylicocyclus nassatus TaxID=53992 RepID=A0AA36H062_CYLNA|nr:unnamed protein product [Cylicocyclus nassatus]